MKSLPIYQGVMYDVIVIQCSPSDVSHIKTFHAINLFQIRVMIQNLFEKRQVFIHVNAEIMRMPPQVIYQSPRFCAACVKSDKIRRIRRGSSILRLMETGREIGSKEYLLECPAQAFREHGSYDLRY